MGLDEKSHTLFTTLKWKIPWFIKQIWKWTAPTFEARRYRANKRKGYYVKKNDEGIMDEVCYVVNRCDSNPGLFADYIQFIKYIEFAERNNMIPIIDRKTTPSWHYQDADKYYKENAWEYYFEQPCGIGLEDLKKYKTIVYCDARYDKHYKGYVYPLGGDARYKQAWGEKEILYWQKIAKQYLRLNKRMMTAVEENEQRLISDRRVLGVSIREGYSQYMESGVGCGHPLQTSVDTYLMDTIQYLSEWECDYVFLACQTIETRQKFMEAFGDRLLYIDRHLANYGSIDDSREFSDNVQTIDKNERCFTYVLEMEMLSKCVSFICSPTSGNNAVVIMKDGLFEHVKCYHNGFYGEGGR